MKKYVTKTNLHNIINSVMKQTNKSEEDVKTMSINEVLDVYVTTPHFLKRDGIQDKVKRQEAICEDYTKGMKQQDILKKHNICISTLYRTLDGNEIPRRKIHAKQDDLINAVKTHVEDGKTLEYIIETEHTSHGRVKKIINDLEKNI